MKEDRKYLLMTQKHSNKEHPLFWGSLTPDDSNRSFSGYTKDPRLAEHYSKSDIIEEFSDSDALFTNFPIRHGIDYVREFSNEDWNSQNSNSEDIFVVTTEDAWNTILK